MSEAVSIRPASAGDLDAIARIQEACPEAVAWEARDYLDFDCLVAECHGTVAGFVVARRLADDEGEVLNLSVAPAFRRRGIGRRLMAEVIGRYDGTLWLEARETNAGARKFYETLGFREAGRRPEYYGDSNEGAIVMNFHS